MNWKELISSIFQDIAYSRFLALGCFHFQIYSTVFVEYVFLVLPVPKLH